MISLRNSNSYILFFAWLIVTMLLVMSNSSMGATAIWLLLWLIGIFTAKKIQIGKIKYKNISIWLVILLYSIAITIINYIIGKNSLNSVYQCLIAFSLPYFAVNMFAKKCNADTVLTLFRNFVILCCILGIAEYLLKIQPYSSFIINTYARNNFELYGNVANALYSYRTTLFFYHPIFYSEFLSCGLAIILYKPFRNKFANLLCLLLLFGSLILTKSRTGWISALVVVILYFIDTNRKKMTTKRLFDILKTIAGMALLLISLYIAKPEIFSTLYSIVFERILQIQDNTAAGARLANLSLISLSLEKNNFFTILFGGGRNYASTLLMHNAQINGWTNAVDNQYLTFFLDYGVVGLVLLIAFYINMLYKFMTSNNAQISIFSCVILSVGVGAFFFEWYNMNTIYYFLLICIAFCNNNDTDNSRYTNYEYEKSCYD